jgi:hypothetical protein
MKTQIVMAFWQVRFFECYFGTLGFNCGIVAILSKPKHLRSYWASLLRKASAGQEHASSLPLGSVVRQVGFAYLF